MHRAEADVSYQDPAAGPPHALKPSRAAFLDHNALGHMTSATPALCMLDEGNIITSEGQSIVIDMQGI